MRSTIPRIVLFSFLRKIHQLTTFFSAESGGVVLHNGNKEALSKSPCKMATLNSVTDLLLYTLTSKYINALTNLCITTAYLKKSKQGRREFVFFFKQSLLQFYRADRTTSIKINFVLITAGKLYRTKAMNQHAIYITSFIFGKLMPVNSI